VDFLSLVCRVPGWCRARQPSRKPASPDCPRAPPSQTEAEAAWLVVRAASGGSGERSSTRTSATTWARDGAHLVQVHGWSHLASTTWALQMVGEALGFTQLMTMHASAFLLRNHAQCCLDAAVKCLMSNLLAWNRHTACSFGPADTPVQKHDMSTAPHPTLFAICSLLLCCAPSWLRIWSAVALLAITVLLLASPVGVPVVSAAALPSGDAVALSGPTPTIVRNCSIPVEHLRR
jgi:hypothetical protein